MLVLTPRRRARATLFAATLLATAGLTAAPAAHAGTYKAWLCKTPDGRATSTDGWLPNNTLQRYVGMGDSCAQGGTGSLWANFGGDGSIAPGGAGHWEFTASPGTSIATARVDYGYGITANNDKGDYYGQAAVGIYRDGFAYDPQHVLMQALSNGTYQTGGSFTEFGINAGRFGFNVGCYGTGQCGSSELGRASMSFGSQEITLVDGSNPATGAAGGTALDPGTKRGTETVRFDASDAGSGIWQAEVKLGDTVVLPRQVFDTNDGHCAEVDVTPGVANEFGWRQPCRLSTTANLSIDTRKVADGEHLLTATVWDAANNATVAVSKKVTVGNGGAGGPGGVADGRPGTPGAPNGTGGDPATGRIVALAAPKVPTRFGRTLGLPGSVVDAAGKPIAGAYVDVFETVDLPGAQATRVGTLQTDAAGNFTHGVTTRSSRTVEFAYAPTQVSDAYIARFSTKALIRATVSLKVRGSARRGTPVTFAGSVAVDPLPAKGARVMIESRSGKRWITAAVVRTRTGGTFRWAHRFRTRGRYAFRARVLSAADLPAKVDASATRSLRVR